MRIRVSNEEENIYFGNMPSPIQTLADVLYRFLEFVPMTRAQRFAAITAVSLFVYASLFFSIISFPLVGKEAADQLITVVRTWFFRSPLLSNIAFNRTLCSSLGGLSSHSGLIR